MALRKKIDPSRELDEVGAQFRHWERERSNEDPAAQARRHRDFPAIIRLLHKVIYDVGDDSVVQLTTGSEPLDSITFMETGEDRFHSNIRRLPPGSRLPLQYFVETVSLEPEAEGGASTYVGRFTYVDARDIGRTLLAGGELDIVDAQLIDLPHTVSREDSLPSSA
jgi:hypothetical protein